MKKVKRIQRHKKITKKISGSSDRPRVAVFKSGQHIYAQVIDDMKHATLVSGSDLKINSGTKTEKAKKVGEELAKKALKKNIKTVVFDRGGFKYHGRIAALAQGLREGGLQF
ncbi:50S ribosomal protein L18 [Candidatus Daviesbacteria bacterium]|nr:50S ribosomal protein L18 [Candidatus Daviesbacteria bacterium]